jgi:hypothetical protein
MKRVKITLTAIIAVAITFTFNACSSSDDPDDPNNPGGGGGIPSQVYNRDGTKYTGNGIIKIPLGYDDNDNIILINVGSVTNGVVKLESYENVPSKYLGEFLEEDEWHKRTCTDYPEGIESFVEDGSFYLANNNGEIIGRLRNGYSDTDGSLEEAIFYAYFTKTGKVACSYTVGPERTQIFNIDAKEGWNTIYYHRAYPNGLSAEEISTNPNILTKPEEMKWVILKQ